jgi:predicted dehydrogenase
VSTLPTVLPVPTVALCGAGRVAALHARGFVNSGARIVAVADPRLDAARRLADEFGGPDIFPELSSLLDTHRPDIVAIATPHDVHAEQAIDALRAGCDVFIDKPLATTLPDAQRVVDEVGAGPRRLGVCHNLLQHEAVAAAAELLADGRLGPILAANAWSLGWLDLAPWDFRHDAARTGGGAWIDNAPHLIYTLEHLLGPFTDLVARTGAAPSRIGGEDTAVAIGRIRDEIAVSIRISYSYVAPGSQQAWPSGWSQGVEINGSRGSLWLSVSPSGRLRHVVGDAAEWIEQDFAEPFAATFERSIAAFLAARADPARTATTAQDSLRVLALTVGALA